MKTINLGCGNSNKGDVRVDIVPTKTTTLVCDLNKKFPFKSDEFDIIYCNEVLEHILNLKNFADECYRILKPNGKMIFRTDNAGYIFFHLPFTAERHHKWVPKCEVDGHYHLFKKEHLERLFKKFSKVTVGYRSGGRNRFMHFILKIIPFNMGAISLEGEVIK